MSDKQGRFALIEQFLADGLDHMFGNPGTVEQGFLDALAAYPEMKYILTLQESIAVLMADGYARARKKPALVQIHSTPGLGNAIGALYQAMRGHSPLVVIGGDAGVQWQNLDAQMAGDLVAMAKPVTKWATQIYDSRNLLRTIRRAIKIAATPPMGPVYVMLPMDLLDQPATEPVRPTVIPSTRVIPPRADLERVADALIKAKTPIFYIGDGVAYADAQKETERLAELLAAEVYGVDSGEINFDTTHPLYRGQTGHMFGHHSLPIIQKGDVNLVVGTYMVPEVFAELGDIFNKDAQVYHIDLNAYEIGKNHPVDLGLVADPKLTLAALTEIIEERLDDQSRSVISYRGAALADECKQAFDSQVQADEATLDQVPMNGVAFMRELAKQAPANLVIFDEALTTSPALTRYLPPKLNGRFMQTRGGSLGVGFPGGIGAQIANPETTVIALSGDGGSMYTIQALWSAVRHKTPVKFIVCNNGSYKLLQLNVQAYWQEREIPTHDYPLPFDLSYPPLKFADIAQSYGVPAVRVEKPEECGPAIEKMLNTDGPFLIDLVLAGDTHPEHIGTKCGQ